MAEYIVEKAFKCPRCDGQGHTIKPPWVPGDQQVWMGTTVTSFPCPPCEGTGLIWKAWHPEETA